MNFFVVLLKGFGLLLTVTCFNQFSLHNPHDLYTQNSLYPHQKIPTPFNPRLFYPFILTNGNFHSLLTFPRVQSCLTKLTGSVNGSCLKLTTCILKGGKPAGVCNFGLKTCCVPFLASSRLPVTTFSGNSLTPSPATFVIRRSSHAFCQVRLDFVAFNVGGVDQNGLCTGGLIVSGEANTNSVPSIICGENTGQHIYLNFNNGNPIMLTVDTSNPTVSDSWNIKATQIPCSDQQNLAPLGCLQYFPEPAGQVESFNFRNIASVPLRSLDQTTYQLSNLNYYACIGTPTNTFTTISWARGTGTTNYYFVLTGLVGVFDPLIAGTLSTAEFGARCTDPVAGTGSLTNDYVEITNGQFTNFTGTQRTESLYCGVGFPPSVTSTSKPFRLHVVTNGYEMRGEGSIGFSLSYILS